MILKTDVNLNFFIETIFIAAKLTIFLFTCKKNATNFIFFEEEMREFVYLRLSWLSKLS